MLNKCQRCGVKKSSKESSVGTLLLHQRETGNPTFSVFAHPLKSQRTSFLGLKKLWESLG
ncbi:hypothetical protein GIB67_030416, partial [Kingdonia uniflora]